MEVVIKISSPQEARALEAFLAVAYPEADTPQVVVEEKEGPQDDPEIKEPAVAKKPQPVAEKKQPVAEKKQPVVKITLADLRAELAPLVKTHREAIKAKLDSLGAKNLTLLEKDKYVEVMTFLVGLK